MKYSLMKDQLNKVFASTSVSVQPKAEAPVKFDPVKIEPVDTYYSRSASSTKHSQAQGHAYRSGRSGIFDN